jgi:protoporphyrinogen/coproporphyrinogen III oxidase
MFRIAIIGGGISGLSAAFRLEQVRREGADVRYTLFESSDRLGGVMRTERVEGCLIEAGPDSFLSEKQSAAELCRELGIADQLVGSNDAHRRTYILVKGRLVEMPDGLQFMVPTKLWPTVTTPLFSFGTKLRMAREFFASPHTSNGDESAAAFVERHFGLEAVDRLADPLLAGVYGGSAERLSVRAVLPRFLDMEARYGSLSRAMLAAMKKRPLAANGPRPIFTSMKDGMQQLVEAVVAQLDPDAIRTGTRIQALGREDGEWVIAAAGVAGDVRRYEKFDRVIIATPAYIAAGLLRSAEPRLAGVLEATNYSSSVTVALGYAAAGYDGRGAKQDDGFGFLVPRSEGKRLLACTFVHNKFPHRAPEDRLLLRVFLGGSHDPGVLQIPDEEILRTVRVELHQILGLTAEPLFSRIYRWERSMAQYEVGHLERVAEIERLRAGLPGLALAGNAYRGIGVPDCIKSGVDAAAEALRS